MHSQAAAAYKELLQERIGPEVEQGRAPRWEDAEALLAEDPRYERMPHRMREREYAIFLQAAGVMPARGGDHREPQHRRRERSRSRSRDRERRRRDRSRSRDRRDRSRSRDRSRRDRDRSRSPARPSRPAGGGREDGEL